MGVATEVAIRVEFADFNPSPRGPPMTGAGQRINAAILAIARKLLTELNAMIRDGAECRRAG